MNYELLKELKDAGFPINTIPAYDNATDMNLIDAEFQFIKPNLSELIEACGDSFFSLKRNRDSTWWAMRFEGGGYLLEDSLRNYATPEEAIARLWFALNKK